MKVLKAANEPGHRTFADALGQPLGTLGLVGSRVWMPDGSKVSITEELFAARSQGFQGRRLDVQDTAALWNRLGSFKVETTPIAIAHEGGPAISHAIVDLERGKLYVAELGSDERRPVITRVGDRAFEQRIVDAWTHAVHRFWPDRDSFR